MNDDITLTLRSGEVDILLEELTAHQKHLDKEVSDARNQYDEYNQRSKYYFIGKAKRRLEDAEERRDAVKELYDKIYEEVMDQK